MARGGYTFSEIRQMDSDELAFLNHYQRRVEEDRFDYIAQLLGVKWDLKQRRETGNKPADNSTMDEIMIPLSVAINPNIVSYVDGLMKDAPQKHDAYIGQGEYAVEGKVEVKSLGDLSKDEFLMMLGKKKREPQHE